MARLPKLNRLKPTLESTSLKLSEENGEFCRVVGKFRNLSGEENKMSAHELDAELEKELLDIQQVAATLEYTLEFLDPGAAREKHYIKMVDKKYMDKMSENFGEKNYGHKVQVYHGTGTGDSLSDILEDIYICKHDELGLVAEIEETTSGATYKIEGDIVVLAFPVKNLIYDFSDNFIILAGKFLPIKDRVVGGIDYGN